MSTDRVLSVVAEGIQTITLNRPDKRNAMDTATVEALDRALADANVNAKVRVVAIRGAGKDFCAGADLQELLDSVDGSLADHEAHAQKLGNVFAAIRQVPKPVVAVVHGRALAGGCGLANACDLVVAHADAQFGYPEIRRGFVPAMVMAMLVRSVGEKVAFDLVATGRVLSANEAAAVGLVSRALPGAEFESTTDDLLRHLSEASGSALALIKQQLYGIDGLSFDEAIALGAQVNAVARSTPDFKDAVARFLEK
jgi:methylglutaconyl-CoA hydratase